MILDGRPGGRTNRIMIVPGGFHSFSLDEPGWRREDVFGTSRFAPLQVPFRRRAPLAEADILGE